MAESQGRLGRLKTRNEDVSKLNPDQILIKWINFHSLRSPLKRTIKNLGRDLKDSEALLYLLHRLNRRKCPIDVMQINNPETRAHNMIDNALAIGVPDIVTT